MQSVLLFLLAAPVYVLLLTTQFEPDITAGDLMVRQSRPLLLMSARSLKGSMKLTHLQYFAAQMVLIVIEIFADQQQWGKGNICS
jgi:steroid 5-alpha reductase family enzyme